MDRQDVEVMHDRIKNGANLLDAHVFQFDFLNDDFTSLPQGLQDIINDSEKRERLVIYINPPYAESNGKITKTRSNVQISTVHSRYNLQLEKLGAELFAQFLIRIYFEIPNCKIGNFSTLKLLNGTNSNVFRRYFLSKLESMFIVPANTFDNVDGTFPVGFFIWNTAQREIFEQITSDVYDESASLIAKKNFYSYDNIDLRINNWLSRYRARDAQDEIGILVADAPDFQNNDQINIANEKGTRHGIYFKLNRNNLIEGCIYFAVRKCIPHTWINHNDQFLCPNNGWENDLEFQSDCLTLTLFDGKNNIRAGQSVNNWIPFTEKEVNAKEKFGSNFMTDFINGKLKTANTDLFLEAKEGRRLEFSFEATEVFSAGKALWIYYHEQSHINPNASLYDIRLYFQGTRQNGSMNIRSDNEHYTELITNLRNRIKILQKKIEPKIYDYNFLKA